MDTKTAITDLVLPHEIICDSVEQRNAVLNLLEKHKPQLVWWADKGLTPAAIIAETYLEEDQLVISIDSDFTLVIAEEATWDNTTNADEIL